MATKQRFRIGISGSYGGMNLGDEAILQLIISQIRSSLDAEIVVFSRYPADTRIRHQVGDVIDVRNLSIKQAQVTVATLDLFILGGGGILYDRDIMLYLRKVKIALGYNIPVMLYAIGVGPLANRSLHPEISELLNRVQVITVRDTDSQHLLESIGVEKDIHVTADPAFLLTAEPLPEVTLVKEHLIKARKLIAMSVREPGAAAPDLDEGNYHGLLANAADYMVDRFDADIIFIPTERKHLDMQHAHAVISMMLKPQHAHVLKGEYTPGELLSIIGHCHFAVGMRLHFLIFAALQNIPFVALPYASKVKGLLTDLGIEMPPFHLVNAGRLIAYIDHSWDCQNQMKEQIKRRLPKIKEKARQTHQILTQLLAREPA